VLARRIIKILVQNWARFNDPDHVKTLLASVELIIVVNTGQEFERNESRLRVMTYNVHACVGTDGRLNLRRIVDVIAQYAPDVVALQELDVGRGRSNFVDQGEEIAKTLKMTHQFFPAIAFAEERYGDAIMSTLPFELVKCDHLPSHPNQRKTVEPRGAIWATVEFSGVKCHVFNTHLGLSKRERQLQLDCLLGPDWVGAVDQGQPVVFCGDFNTMPKTFGYRKISRCFKDVQTARRGFRPKRTWTSRVPVSRIDHIFVNKRFEVRTVLVPRTALTKRASDHLPVVADLVLASNISDNQ